MSGIDLSTLNDEQMKIVTKLDVPLFVEAGAGSGKTFTLTRRIAWALSPGSAEDGGAFLDSLSQVLVITFTNAAAREIKERVRSTLRAAGMRQAALEVDSAWISTIHGMCSRILKRHALDLGLDPDFRVGIGNETNELFVRALEEVVGTAVREAPKGSSLRAAVAEYGVGRHEATGYSGLFALVADVVSAANAAPRGFDSLRVGGEPDVRGAVARLERSVEALGAQRKLSASAKAAIANSLECLKAYTELPPDGQTPEAAEAALGGVKLPRSSAAIAELLPDAKQALAEASLEAALARVYPMTGDVIDLARRTQERFFELKLERSILDNDDLIALALAAVRDNPAVAADYAGRFRLVMVDEFQDTDVKQLELIGILSGEGARHLATVGDAQQSIYRFRGADVSVFRGRGRDLPAENHVQLAVNYRSHQDILSFVDAVCGGDRGVVSGFMHLDHNPRRDDSYVARDLPRIDLELVSGQSRVTQSQSAVVANQIAHRLREYADAGERPGGMALLLGANTHSDLYIDAIRAQGLECVVTGGSSFTSAPEVAVMAALLHFLANPADTASGLFPVLTSELFDLDADDLVQLGTRPQQVLDAPTKRGIDRGIATMEFFRGAEPSRRLARAHEILLHAEGMLQTTPVADVCRYVVRTSGWLARLEHQGSEGRAREANVLAAIRYIRDLTDELGLGAARAAHEFDVWLETSKIPPASLAGGEMQSVRVMTVHASKGLEFPVTAVSECWSVLAAGSTLATGRTEDGSQMVVMAPSGAAKLAASLAPEGEPESLAEWYQDLRQRTAEDDAAEKTRLLYVALTRAREALIVGMTYATTKTGTSPRLAGDVINALYAGGEPPLGDSLLDYGGTGPARVCRVHLSKSDGGPMAESAGASPYLEGRTLPPDPRAISVLGAPDASGEGMGEGLEPHAAPGERSFELFSVEDDSLAGMTALGRSREGVFSYSSAHAAMGGLEAPLVEDGSDAVPVAPLLPGERNPRSAEVPLPTRAERDAEQEGAPQPEDADKATSFGSAFHELAQAIVESGQRFPSEERVAATKRYWKLPERQRRRLDAALDRWFGSDVRHEVLGYPHVRSEVPFFVPAESRFGSHVEGAIDLLGWEDDHGRAMVVDYKTGDRGLTASQIRARHEMQANFYASVLMGQGFRSVVCCFVCVELEGPAGGPFCVRYEFDGVRSPEVPWKA